MKNYLIIFILISALVLSFGCTDKGNQTSQNSKNDTKTFTGDDISFQYPGSWKTIGSQSRDSVIAVGDPATNDGNGNARVNVLIQKTVLPQGQTFLQYYNSTYTQYKSQNLGFEPVSEGTVVVNGITAYENIYKINSGEQKEQRAIWIQKGGLIYIILCSAPVAEFNNQQANFDIIVNSFKFQ